MVSTIDRPAALLRLVGAPDDFVEPLDELFLGARERLLDPSKKPMVTRLPPRAGGGASALRPLRRRAVPVEDRLHLRRDRQLDAVPRAERERRAGRAHAFRHHPHAAERISSSDRPRPSSMPTLAVAAQVSGARQHEVARGRSVRRACRDVRLRRTASREISASPRVISAASALCPRPSPSTHAGRNRDDVLQRAADLDAGDVVARRRAGGPAAEVFLHGGGRRVVGRRGEHRRRQPARDFEREARTREHDDRQQPAVSSSITCDIRRSDVGLEPLRGADEDRAGLEVRRRMPHDGAEPVRRHGDHDEARAVERGRRAIAVGTIRFGQRHVRQIAVVRRGALAAPRRTPRRAPTGGRRGRRARGGRRARCPSCRRRAPRSSSCPRPHAPLGARCAAAASWRGAGRGSGCACRPRTSTTGSGAPDEPGRRRQRDGRGDRSERDVARDPRR